MNFVSLRMEKEEVISRMKEAQEAMELYHKKDIESKVLILRVYYFGFILSLIVIVLAILFKK